MNITFTRENREGRGEFKASTGGKMQINVHGVWETGRFEDEFEFAEPDGSIPKTDEFQALATWMADNAHDWLQLLRVPYCWTRITLDSVGFSYEIRQDDDTVVIGTATLSGDFHTRWSADFVHKEDLDAAVTEIEWGINWIQDEFAGREHGPVSLDEYIDVAADEDDPFIIDPKAEIDFAQYATMVGRDFREYAAAVKEMMGKYRLAKQAMHLTYRVASDMHKRQVIGHDGFDEISSILEIHNGDILKLTDYDGNEA